MSPDKISFDEPEKRKRLINYFGLIRFFLFFLISVIKRLAFPVNVFDGNRRSAATLVVAITYRSVCVVWLRANAAFSAQTYSVVRQIPSGRYSNGDDNGRLFRKTESNRNPRRRHRLIILIYVIVRSALYTHTYIYITRYEIE